MKIKKILALCISIIMATAPILGAVNGKTTVIRPEKVKELFIDDYLKEGVHIPILGFKDAPHLVAYMKKDILKSEDINKVKNCYYEYFKLCLYQNLITNNQDDEQIYDIFTFFFSYVILKTITEELQNERINFSALKNIFKYLRDEDMHFLFHAYIVANSHSYFSPASIYINNAIKELAKKGNEKPKKITEDLIHKAIRKNPLNEDIINLLKAMYNEHLLNFNSFYENSLRYLTTTQEDILVIILKIIANYKKIGIKSNAIDLYSSYFNAAYSSTNNPR